MKLTPKLYKILLSIYPPYLGAGIRIKSVSKDWRNMEVSLTKYWFNNNAVGTHFGGSIYSMTDPHIMLMLMNLLGKEYIVWDKAASIDYIKAVKEKVTACFSVSDEQLQEIKKATATGEKYLPEFIIDIKTEDGTIVAKVLKTVYIKKKKNS